MRLEFKEHELERALEQYLQLQFNKEVKVNGFDLSGMRSKDGLTAMVDITLLGETDQREPKEDSPNVNPTNTSWRQEGHSETKEPKKQLIEKSDDYYKVLELLGSNPKNRNRKAIEELTQDNLDLVQQLSSVGLYQDWLNQCLKEDATAFQETPTTELQVEVVSSTLDEEERSMDEIVMGDSILDEADDKQTSTHQPDETELSDEEEEALVNSLVTTTNVEKPTTLVDEVLNPTEPKVKNSIFGQPLNKPTRKLFG